MCAETLHYAYGTYVGMKILSVNIV